MKTKEEIEQLASKRFIIKQFIGEDDYNRNETIAARRGYVEAYSQCQEDNKDKKYTEEDLLHAFREGVLLPNSQIGIMEDIFKQIVQSLNKQD